MFYTVVRKSGWNTDTNWHIARTFTDRAKAREFAANRKASDPKSDWHNVKVVGHRKPLANYSTDAETYRIGGMTCIG